MQWEQAFPLVIFFKCDLHAFLHVVQRAAHSLYWAALLSICCPKEALAITNYGTQMHVACFPAVCNCGQNHGNYASDSKLASVIGA